jgi:hypothetical protein
MINVAFVKDSMIHFEQGLEIEEHQQWRRKGKRETPMMKTGERGP